MLSFLLGTATISLWLSKDALLPSSDALLRFSSDEGLFKVCQSGRGTSRRKERILGMMGFDGI